MAEALTIGERETAGELHDRLAGLGGSLLANHLAAIVAGDVLPTPQDESLATYAGKINKADAEIDWRADADELERRVRAYNPVPTAWFQFDGQRTKCWTAESGASVDAPPGTVVSSGADGIVVACGTGTLRMTSLQRPGKRQVSAQEFASQVDLSGRCLL